VLFAGTPRPLLLVVHPIPFGIVLLALCVPLVGRDGDDPTDSVAQKKYATQALELLSDALDAGFDDVDHLSKDPDLDAIRTYSDYVKILKRIEGVPPRK